MFIGCAQGDNGLIFGTPYYEKRDIKVTQIDLDILRRCEVGYKYGD